MGFAVVEHEIRHVWMPVNYNSTVYVGSLVTLGTFSSCGGVKPIGAAGAGPVTATLPFGIVVGVNNYKDVFSTAYNSLQGTAVQSQANLALRDFRLQEGMWAKGDPQLFAKIAVIDPTSTIRGPIFTTTFGVAPTVNVVGTGSSDGSGFTATATCGFTPVAQNATWYGRSGANMGFYRVGTDTSTTIHTFGEYWPQDITATTDTFVGVNVGLGRCKMDFDATGSFINNGSALSNYYIVNVLKLDLSVAGQCYAEFRFIGL